MIGDQTKILPGPGVLDRPTSREIGIVPMGIVTQDQLLRRMGNRVLAWEPGQIRQHQFPSRFQPCFDQGEHTLHADGATRFQPKAKLAGTSAQIPWAVASAWTSIRCSALTCSRCAGVIWSRGCPSISSHRTCGATCLYHTCPYWTASSTSRWAASQAFRPPRYQ